MKIIRQVTVKTLGRIKWWLKTVPCLAAGLFSSTSCLRFQALNNLQSTNSGFGYINSENVFKVCDEPHPLLVKSMLGHCVDGNIDEAYKVVEQLWALGYSPEDIIGNIFRVCKTYQMAEYLKLEFIKVRQSFNSALNKNVFVWVTTTVLCRISAGTFQTFY